MALSGDTLTILLAIGGNTLAILAILLPVIIGMWSSLNARIDNRIDRVEHRIDRVEQRLEALSKWVDGLDRDIRDILLTHDHDIEELKRRS